MLNTQRCICSFDIQIFWDGISSPAPEAQRAGAAAGPATAARGMHLLLPFHAAAEVVEVEVGAPTLCWLWGVMFECLKETEFKKRQDGY